MSDGDVDEGVSRRDRRSTRIFLTIRRSFSTRNLPSARDVLGPDYEAAVRVPPPPAGFPPATAPLPPGTLPSALGEKHRLSYAVVSATCGMIDQMRDVQGLFRVSGAHKLSGYITKALAAAAEDPKMTKESVRNRLETIKFFSPHELATSLKKYLRDLEEPLVPLPSHNRFLAAYHEFQQSGEIRELREVGQRMQPHLNRMCMHRLLVTLAGVASQHQTNLMTAANLGAMIAPAVFLISDVNPRTMAEHAELCATLISSHVEIFGDTILPMFWEERSEGGVYTYANIITGQTQTVRPDYEASPDAFPMFYQSPQQQQQQSQHESSASDSFRMPTASRVSKRTTSIFRPKGRKGDMSVSDDDTAPMPLAATVRGRKKPHSTLSLRTTGSRDISSSVLLAPRQPLPEGWEERRDQSGRAYYYNSVLRVSQWTRPSPAQATPVQQSSATQSDHLRKLCALTLKKVPPPSPPHGTAISSSPPSPRSLDSLAVTAPASASASAPAPVLPAPTHAPAPVQPARALQSSDLQPPPLPPVILSIERLPPLPVSPPPQIISLPPASPLPKPPVTVRVPSAPAPSLPQIAVLPPPLPTTAAPTPPRLSPPPGSPPPGEPPAYLEAPLSTSPEDKWVRLPAVTSQL